MIHTSSIRLLTETQKVAKSLGTSQQGVVVELDLKATNCPELVIKPIKDYIEGSAMQYGILRVQFW